MSRSSDHCNENTGVKPFFVSSRRILRLVIVDKAKRLCVVSELRSRRRVSVPHRVSADSRRGKHISTSHGQSRQSLFGASSGLESVIFVSEMTVFFLSGRPCALGQCTEEVHVSFTDLALKLFARAFVVSRTHAAP